MVFSYNILIQLYRLVIGLGSFWNPKARLWLNGRKNIFRDIEKQQLSGKKNVWFHCASLGEFEQGRPLLEEFKKQHPEFTIILTFFSPSGYEIKKKL
jgi:3-deoxy-D-manno-octulosonic-acid transferase